ncbi:MAG: amylo-alpha-1,6-glucosidase [Armatimonadota bacterium]
METVSLFQQLRLHVDIPQAASRHDRSAVTSRSSTPEAVVAEDVYVYRVADDALAHGSSLGNSHAWLTSKGTGALEHLFHIDTGVAIMGAFHPGYFARYRDLTAEEEATRIMHEAPSPDDLVRLAPVGTGTYLIHPAYQQRHLTLTGQLEVLETFFLPRLQGGDDPCAAYFISEVRNVSSYPMALLLNAAWDPVGESAPDLCGRYDPDAGLLLWSEGQPAHARLLRSMPMPDDYTISRNLDLVSNPVGRFGKAMEAQGQVYAAVQHQVTIMPGDTTQVAYLLLFHPEGAEAAATQAERLPGAEDALRQTMENYHASLLTADVMTPDTLINQGAQWCKANMLRVLAQYPTGRAFTNDPGRSSNVVGRDVAWYAFGSDAFLPEASCQMLAHLARLQQDDGKIIEYYNARTGEGDDYGLNINDNTPLFVLAVAHHLRMTGHRHCWDRLVEPMCRAVEHCLTQRDDRGLVYCTASGTGEHGICGWRNVMTGERISGAVTEVNSECYAALCAAADTVREAFPARADRYQEEAEQLRAAIHQHLFDPQTGMYYLTLDIDGHPRTDITADLIFPLMFGVADQHVNHLVSARLNREDLMTSAGMRTVPTTSLRYHPDHMVGLTGGVWPGVTWWYAMGCSHVNPGIMVESLKVSYRQFLRNPKIYGTVPGQFCEWFDGESLVNRGMRLSPWEPPRFLWAILEGAFGITLHGATFSVQPRLPAHWSWYLLRNFPFRGERYSWFMGRVEREFTVFTTKAFETPYPVEAFDQEVTGDVRVVGEQATMIAWQREGEVLIALGTESEKKIPVLVHLSERLRTDGASTHVSIYRSEAGHWSALSPRPAAELEQFSLWLDAGGFALIRLCDAAGEPQSVEKG